MLERENMGIEKGGLMRGIITKSPQIIVMISYL